ncbi:MAG: DUF6282 family protein [Dehalococcoidia bacterium]
MATDRLDELPERARELLRGATDIHVHFAPDAFAERRMDARDLVRQAGEAGMAGLVLKSHEYPTQPLAWALASADGAPEVALYGGLSLDHAAGGLNVDALEVSLRLGARVVWMPTFDAEQWRNYRPQMVHSAKPGIEVVDGDGALLSVMHEILDLLSEYDAVLASGHLSTAETATLVTEARRRELRTVITHAAFWIPVEVQQRLAALGAFVEQCGGPTFHEGAEDAAAGIFEQVRAVGPQQVILSTDLGQAANPDPPYGFGLWIESALDAGFSAAEVGQMVRDNPRTLLVA